MSILHHQANGELARDPRSKAYCKQLPYLDVLIFSFHYVLDPKVAENVSAELSKESIVVFDEAHNIGASSLCSVF